MRIHRSRKRKRLLKPRQSTVFGDRSFYRFEGRRHRDKLFGHGALCGDRGVDSTAISSFRARVILQAALSVGFRVDDNGVSVGSQ